MAVLVTCNQAGDAAVKACDEIAWAMIERELARREREQHGDPVKYADE